MDGLHSHLTSLPVVRGVRQRIRALGAALLFAVLVCSVYAAEKEIVVAQVAPFSGPVSFYARETQLGAAAYFSAVNAKGGVRGAKIRFVTRDDGLDPTKTVALFREVAGGEAPVYSPCSIDHPSCARRDSSITLSGQ
ncbi:ABC transporter substrate-binding protein [Acidovorax sp. D2M1]|jgi:ABC-type branched-subunit amino acid transport system substrate-binding protein|uniref:ABC transporter substrate-binding protein n=1 Tax=Acidovorax benzenivorans TaxID=2987520 RepID=A0ABT5RS42_9BURK|nr:MULTISPECIES: ABC transporter substrate-binding protein [Comamonadaceae]MDD2176499.1 ABC transporter substrate-binding protein [Acidovorax benzenivorans]